MNILKKKLYYKFLDLQRLSRFTGEVGLCDFAISVLNKIKNISDENFDVELYDTKKTIFTDKEKTFIDEYIATGQIQFIEDIFTQMGLVADYARVYPDRRVKVYL